MSVQASRDDRDVQRITEALRTPLPPARLRADPSALWACGRQARRIGAEARISLVVTAAEVSALVGVLGVLVSFVDWHLVWTTSARVLETDPLGGIYAALALVATGAVAWTSRALLRKT